MSDWITQVVEADGTPVQTLHVEPGAGSITMGLPEGASAPNRISGLVVDSDELPDMAGRFIVDRWTGAPGPGDWWLLNASAPEELGDAGARRTLSGVDLTGLLARRGLTREEILPPGRFVLEAVNALIDRYLPGHAARFRVVDVDTSLRAELAFGVGSSLAQATVEPLLAGAMTAWSPLPGGLVESTPWKPPAERPTVAVFADETEPDASPFLPDWSRDRLSAALAPNEVLAVARSSSGGPDLVGRWADEVSIARHGAHTVHVPGQVEATSQAAADLIARRFAETEVRPRAEIEFSGAFHPIRPGQVARVVWERHGIRGRFELVSKTIQRTPSARTAYRLREV